MDFLNAIIVLLNYTIIPALTYGSQLALGAIFVSLIYGIWGPSECHGSIRLVELVCLLVARASQPSERANILKKIFQNQTFQLFRVLGVNKIL